MHTFRTQDIPSPAGRTHYKKRPELNRPFLYADFQNGEVKLPCLGAVNANPSLAARVKR